MTEEALRPSGALLYRQSLCQGRRGGRIQLMGEPQTSGTGNRLGARAVGFGPPRFELCRDSFILRARPVDREGAVRSAVSCGKLAPCLFVRSGLNVGWRRVES